MRVAPHTSPDLRRHWIFDRVVRQVHSACDWHPPNILSVWNVLNLILYHTTHIEIQIGRLTYGYIAGAQLGCNDTLSLLGGVSFASSGAEEMRPLRMHHQVINRTCCNVDHEPTDSHQHTEYATPFQSLTELLLTLATFIRSVPTAKE
jgi:hypothetical protein